MHTPSLLPRSLPIHVPLSPLPSAWRCIWACVGVIVGRHCRNLAAAAVWRAAPRWVPFSGQRAVRLGSFTQPYKSNGLHKGDYKPRRIPVGTWEWCRCEAGRKGGEGVEGPRGCSPSERRLHGNRTVPRPHISKVLRMQRVRGGGEKEFGTREGIRWDHEASWCCHK